MAYADDLKSIRDNLVAELLNETARRKALTAAGNPPPTTYQVGGKQYAWNDYISMMREQIRQTNLDVIAAGGDGGILDELTTGYS